MNVCSEFVHRTGFRIRTASKIDQPPYWLFMTTHPELWVCVGWTDVRDASEHAELLTPVTFARMASCVALVGVSWERLQEEGAPFEQMGTLAFTPQRFLDLPLEEVWAVRRNVIGSEMGRVVAALLGTEKYGDPRNTVVSDVQVRRG